MKIDIKSIICTAAATLIMLTFFVVKTLGVFDIITHTQSVDVFEYISVILFMPFFFYLGWQVYNNNRKERINRKALQDILDDSCLVSRADTKGKITYVNEMFCKINNMNYLVKIIQY
jgi:cation transport ATPase